MGVESQGYFIVPKDILFYGFYHIAYHITIIRYTITTKLYMRA